MNKNKKIAVAMSGGVDSSLAAALLTEKGYDVFGVTFRLHESQDEESVLDARKVAKQIGIYHHIIDLNEPFEKEVIHDFCQEYEKGRTPNPCVVCNTRIKFGALLHAVQHLGASYLATGHYAQVKWDAQLDEFQLKKGVDKRQDQSYVLWGLNQDQVKYAVFPLGGYEKKTIRKMAGERNFVVSSKPDSQEICFIPDHDYHRFLISRNPQLLRKGPMKTLEGETVGMHKGIAFYTIGQRRNLGIALGYPVYVAKIDAPNNTVYVGKKDQVFHTEVYVKNVNAISEAGFKEEIEVAAKIRYNMEETKALLKPVNHKTVILLFDQPQWAVAPGQSAVFYQDDILLGGGIIEKKL